MKIRIVRTRMAMEGNFYGYDAYVDAADVDPVRVQAVSHFTLLDSDLGRKWMSVASATRPLEHLRMERGVCRYAAYQEHEKALRPMILEAARTVFPELEAVEVWPLLWTELPGFVASHDSRDCELDVFVNA